MFVLTLVLSALAFAQPSSLGTSQRVATLTAAEFNKRMRAAYPNAEIESLRGSLNLYKVTYRSVDAKGKNAVLSGLVALPEQGAPNGLIVFNHGTMVSRKTVPSAYRGDAKASETQHALLAFGSGGYAIAMPDYIGQGDHKGSAHPYPASVTNARAGVDLISAAREVARRNRVTVGRPLFVTGYSEGGGVAMAQTRLLERSSDPMHRVTAAAPAAGPYDLSTTTIDFMAERPVDQLGFVLRTFLLGYGIHSLHKNQGVKIADYFKKSMAFTINLAYGGGISDEDVVKRLGLTAVLMRANNDLYNVITDRFKNAIEKRDFSDPFLRQLRDNDSFDWSPRTRMLLIALVNDSVVTPKNTQVAMRTMRRNGVGRDTLRQSIIQDKSLNHLNAMPESLLRARLFFDRGFAGVREIDDN
ncbi:MAG: alpha/beta hydrolase family protein [Pyrinomonadaceae bacterium]